GGLAHVGPPARTLHRRGRAVVRDELPLPLTLVHEGQLVRLDPADEPADPGQLGPEKGQRVLVLDEEDRIHAPLDLGPQHALDLGYLLLDRKSTRLNSSHVKISYAVFCLKKKKKKLQQESPHDKSRQNVDKRRAAPHVDETERAPR